MDERNMEGMHEEGAFDAVSSGEQRPAWTFLSNYAHVLLCIARNPDTRIRDIAADVAITQRAVARILSELEAAGVVDKERKGRRNHYKVRLDAPLRHSLERDRTVGDLLNALTF